MHMCTIKNRIVDDLNFITFFSLQKIHTFINERYKTTSLDLLKKIFLQEDLSITTKIYSHFIKPEGTLVF